MKKALLIVVVTFGMIGMLMATMASANSAVGGDEPAIMVSPQNIVVAKVSTVTVHTNIPAAIVIGESVDLDGAVPTSLFADDLGHLVAKFAVDDLGLEPGAVTLTLSGVCEDGTSFSATDDVRVK